MALFKARPMSGVVGETKRMVHLFEVSPIDAPVPERLTALCGASFGHGELELLTVLAGMPCFACLQKTPRPSRPTKAA
nr:hypothetical protein [Amycolatopsis xylanica]